MVGLVEGVHDAVRAQERSSQRESHLGADQRVVGHPQGPPVPVGGLVGGPARGRRLRRDPAGRRGRGSAPPGVSAAASRCPRHLLRPRRGQGVGEPAVLGDAPRGGQGVEAGGADQRVRPPHPSGVPGVLDEQPRVQHLDEGGGVGSGEEAALDLVAGDRRRRDEVPGRVRERRDPALHERGHRRLPDVGGAQQLAQVQGMAGADPEEHVDRGVVRLGTVAASEQLADGVAPEPSGVQDGRHLRVEPVGDRLTGRGDEQQGRTPGRDHLPRQVPQEGQGCAVGGVHVLDGHHEPFS